MSDQLIDVRTLLAASAQTRVEIPGGIVRFASAQELSVGRNVDQVLRVLDALQAGGLAACNWKRGDAALSPR